MERGLADSRTAARRAIESGLVTVAGMPAPKPSTLVDRSTPVTVGDGGRRWAGRGGDKLDGALASLDVAIEGRRALDVGASTGGFTDVLLARGADSVMALDVGYGQLLWRLRTDPRVRVVDRTNFRDVDPAEIGAPFGVVTVDVSFISLSLLAAQLAACGEEGTDYVILVKPQFEVGRDRVGKGGVVVEDSARADAAVGVARSMQEAGLTTLGAVPSPLPGEKGNREIFLHACHSSSGGISWRDIVAAVSAS